MSESLCGLRVVITRPAHQAQTLAHHLQVLQAQVFLCPTLSIEPIPKPELAWPYSLAAYQTAIFISKNAVDYALQALDKQQASLKHLRIAAIGKATASALNQYGFEVNYQPVQGFTSEDLLQLPSFQALSAQSMILFQGLGGRSMLVDTLRQRGMQVEVCSVYRRVPAPIPTIDWQVVDWVMITSLEGLQHLATRWEPSLITKIKLLVGSHRIAEAAKCLGFTRLLIATDPSDAAMVEALLNAPRDIDYD